MNDGLNAAWMNDCWTCACTYVHIRTYASWLPECKTHGWACAAWRPHLKFLFITKVAATRLTSHINTDMYTHRCLCLCICLYICMHLWAFTYIYCMPLVTRAAVMRSNAPHSCDCILLFTYLHMNIHTYLHMYVYFWCWCAWLCLAHL